MSDVAMELLSVTLTRAPLGLKLDAYGFLAAVLDTAEDATRRALRPCDELIGINGTLYDDIPTESTPDAAAELCDLVGEYVECTRFNCFFVRCLRIFCANIQISNVFQGYAMHLRSLLMHHCGAQN